MTENQTLVQSMTNKEILFLYTLLADYNSMMAEEITEAKRKQGLVRAIVEFTDDAEDKKKEFVEVTNKMTTSALRLLNGRQQAVEPILQKLEAAYDMIAEAEPELLAEIEELVKGDTVKAEFEDIITNLQNGRD